MDGTTMSYWRPVAEAGDDLGCGRLTVRQTTLHLHEEWQFAAPDGPSKLSLGAFRRYDAHEAHVTAVAPCAVHAEGSATPPPTSWSVLYVAPRLLQQVTGGASPVFPHPVVTDPAGAHELRRLVRESGEGTLVGSAFLARASFWLRRLLAGAVDRGVERPARASAVDRVLAYLQAHATDPVGPDELAWAGVTASLSRSFSRTVGLPPGRYHLQLRLARARRLLAAGMSATRVAYECGFADQSHLSRRFKDCHGVSPGVFQVRWRGTARGAA